MLQKDYQPDEPTIQQGTSLKANLSYFDLDAGF